MKKKIIALATVGVLAISSVVSAASIWGTYKGNDVIRLTVNGAPVKVTDVPAISYNNRTMIPISLLQQAGISYSWDQTTKTVDIKNVVNSTNTVSSTTNQNSDEISEISNFVSSVKKNMPSSIPMADYSINIDELGAYAHSVYNATNAPSNSKITDDVATISALATALNQPISGTIVELYVGNAISDNIYVKLSDSIQFVKGNISKSEYVSRWSINSYNNSTPTTSNTKSTSSTCKMINDRYDNLKRSVEESYGSSGFGRSSAVQEQLNNIEKDRNNELMQSGCSAN